MLPIDIREPINALSHGAGMMMALPVTWFLLRQCGRRNTCRLENPCGTPRPCVMARGKCRVARHQRLKTLSLLVFGITLTFCYAASAVFHAVTLSGEPLSRFQRLDHIGIYLLIAGTYTPIVWSLLRGGSRWGTLATVWTIAAVCAARVWCGGVLPTWVSTLIYLTMGWGSLFCYLQLSRIYSHRTLLPLPLGGLFYSIGAVMNLAHWPVVYAGVFAWHEIFHLFVIAGSACHVFFMLNVVVPAPWPGSVTMPVRSRPWAPLLLRWARAMLSRRVRRWMLNILPHTRWIERLLTIDPLDPGPAEGPAKVV
jgi:hemolysin III